MRSSDRSEVQETYRNRCHFWCHCIIDMIALFVVCLLFRLVVGCSISSCLFPYVSFANNMRSLVNSSAILKVSEAVGLSSLPIAAVFAVWRRNELGLKYSELLDDVCPEYIRYVLLHFVAVLCCFWFSSTGTLELALLSLFVVLLGFPLQWAVLCALVLNPKDRRTIAIGKWQSKLRLLGGNSCGITDFYDICSYAVHCLDTDGIYNERTPAIFADGLFKFVEDRLEDASYSAAQRLYEIQVIWDQLLFRRSLDEQEVLLRRIFQHLATKQGKDHPSTLGMICTGYVLSLHHSCVIENMSRGEAPVKVLIQVSNEVTLLRRNIFGQQENPIVHYLNTVILFLDIMYAQHKRPYSSLQNLPSDLRDLITDLKESKLCHDTENVCKILKGIKEYLFDSCSDALFEHAYSYATRFGSNAG